MSDDGPLNESVFTELLNESMRRNICIRGGRDYCCEYHQGFEDGMHALADRYGSDAD